MWSGVDKKRKEGEGGVGPVALHPPAAQQNSNRIIVKKTNSNYIITTFLGGGVNGGMVPPNRGHRYMHIGAPTGGTASLQ